MVKKLLIIAFFLAIFAYSLLSLIKIVTTFAPDFYVYYNASKAFINHENIYHLKNLNIFGYPPVTSILLGLLSLIPYRVSQLLFVSVSFVLIPFIVYLCIRLSSKKFRIYDFLFLYTLSLLYFPTKFTLGLGQDNFFALFFVVSSYFLKQRKTVAGIFLAFGIILKPILVVILIFYVLNKEWKILALCFVTFIIVFVLTILYGQFYLYQEYLTKVVPTLFSYEGREIYYDQGFTGFISRLISDNNLRRVLAILFAFVILTITTFLSTKSKDRFLVFALFLAQIPLIDSLSWQHHFIFLIPLFSCLYFRFKDYAKLLVLLFIAFTLAAFNFKNPGSMNILLISNVFYGGLLLFLLAIWQIIKDYKYPSA